MDSSDNVSFEKLNLQMLMTMVMGTATVTALQFSIKVREMMTLPTYAISSAHQKCVSLEIGADIIISLDTHMQMMNKLEHARLKHLGVV